jgi:hypothetical protein
LATSPLSKGFVSFATSYGQVSFVYSSLVDTKIRDGGIISLPIPCGQHLYGSKARAVKTFHEDQSVMLKQVLIPSSD